MMRRLYVPRFSIEAETVWPILEGLCRMKLDDILFNRWHSPGNNDTGSIQIPDGHESKNSWVPLLFKITMPKQGTDHAMYFQWSQSIMIFDCSNLFLVQPAKSQASNMLAFWFKDIGNGQKTLIFSCSFGEHSCRIRSDGTSIYHRQNIYQASQFIRSIACVMPRR